MFRVELQTKVDLPGLGVLNHPGRIVLVDHLTSVDEVGADPRVSVSAPLLWSVIRDAQAAVPQATDDLSYLVHRDGVDARKRFVQQHQPRTRDQGARDFEAAFLTAAQLIGEALREGGQFQFLKEVPQPGVALLAVCPRISRIARRFAHRELSEDAGFLRQVADPP